MPTAASQIWPHLAHDDERVAKPSKCSVADALWPAWSREQKAQEHDQRLWDEICKRNREVLRQGLREAVANLPEEKR